MLTLLENVECWYKVVPVPVPVLRFEDCTCDSNAHMATFSLDPATQRHLKRQRGHAAGSSYRNDPGGMQRISGRGWSVVGLSCASDAVC
jgi:hypothetical protein